MESGQRFETHRLDHLGIMVRISQEIRLIEIVDQQVGLVERKISCGQAVQAMILNALMDASIDRDVRHHTLLRSFLCQTSPRAVKTVLSMVAARADWSQIPSSWRVVGQNT